MLWSYSILLPTAHSDRTSWIWKEMIVDCSRKATVWRHWGNPQKTSNRAARLRADIWTRDLPNKKEECQRPGQVVVFLLLYLHFSLESKILTSEYSFLSCHWTTLYKGENYHRLSFISATSRNLSDIEKKVINISKR